MKYLFKYIYLYIIVLIMTACAGHDSESDQQPVSGTTAPLMMYISLPQANDEATSRVGDPGTSTGETQDWDRLTLVGVYKSKATGENIFDPNPDKMVYYDTFTKEEFDCKNADGTMNTKGVEHSSSILKPILNADGTDSGMRYYTMYLPLGTMRVYGVTYSNGMIDVESMLNTIPQDGKDHNADILQLKISNDYATTNGNLDVAKFLSVATGYGVNTKDKDNPTPDLTVVLDNDAEMHEYWNMTLHRLAAKIDVQWDTYEAFNSQKNTYTKVDVDGFTYNGGSTALSASDPASGYGRLFPFAELLSGTSSFTALGGKKTFVNTSTISKRNGRVYHYIFPDGSKTPNVSFNLNTEMTTKDTEGNITGTEQKQRTYIYDFSTVAPLQPATWYKINTTIKGNSQENTTIIIDKFNTGS